MPKFQCQQASHATSGAAQVEFSHNGNGRNTWTLHPARIIPWAPRPSTWHNQVYRHALFQMIHGGVALQINVGKCTCLRWGGKALQQQQIVEPRYANCVKSLEQGSLGQKPVGLAAYCRRHPFEAQWSSYVRTSAGIILDLSIISVFLCSSHG